MCGIVGAIRRAGAVLDSMVEGLRTLEYRGYDSAGVAAVVDGEIQVRRRAGRIDLLEQELADGALAEATSGIGHTRWATHGPPTDENAHPHTDGTRRFALVHNGIIENYLELRAGLERDGVELASETDTEVLAHVIGRELTARGELVAAVRAALSQVRGYYAIALLGAGEDPLLVCARHGPPLCVAAAPEGAWLGSDVLAILPHTQDVAFLEDGDVAVLRPGALEIHDAAGAAVERATEHIEWEAEDVSRAGYPHFMLKEIHEQPDVVARAAAGRIDLERGDVRFEEGGFDDEALRAVERIQILACGTALHAGLVAKYQIEGLAGVPVDVDYASEFRYREPVLAPGTLAIGISQSGETADTLAALRLATERGCRPASICNSLGSTLVRESEATILIHAGVEIGVASTKAFTAMVVASYLLAVRLGRARGNLDAERGAELLQDLTQMRGRLQHLLADDAVNEIQHVAMEHAGAKGFLFLGRGIQYPVALEGALKLKEISYVHAEGYPAGEMKHGPIALIEPDLSTLALAPSGALAEKMRSNIEQVRARGGRVICVGTDATSLELADDAVVVPESLPWLAPLLTTVPLQLFAYYVAAHRGCDIDKPRNLAKSVTVE
jgi:glucosamine--fructose-6-phosphate aminotransferase (isomerizing)